MDVRAQDALRVPPVPLGDSLCRLFRVLEYWGAGAHLHSKGHKKYRRRSDSGDVDLCLRTGIRRVCSWERQILGNGGRGHLFET